MDTTISKDVACLWYNDLVLLYWLAVTGLLVSNNARVSTGLWYNDVEKLLSFVLHLLVFMASMNDIERPCMFVVQRSSFALAYQLSFKIF